MKTNARRLTIGMMALAAAWAFAPRVLAEGTNAPEAARRAYGRGDLRKLVAVVKTKTPPKIDGVMEQGEWDNAAAITGLIKVSFIRQYGVSGSKTGSPGEIINMADHQSCFWLSYDDDNLYVAHHSPPPPEIEGNTAMIPVMLRRNQTVGDSNLDEDDSIYIAIIDPKYPGGDKYVMQINSIGTAFDCIWNSSYTWEEELIKKRLGNYPGITLAWNPKIVTGSTLTLDGWFIELAIPWAELGPHIKKPAPGDVKHMNFGRIWKEMMDEGHAWAADEDYSPAGELVFVGGQGIVIQLKDTGVLSRGRAAFSADIKNLYATGQKLIAEVTTDSGELHDKKEITLATGASTEYKFQGLIGNSATTKIAFTVTDAETGKAIHVTTLPVIRPTAPDLYLYKYRSQNLLKLWTDITYIGTADLKGVSIAVTARNKATGKKCFRHKYKGFDSYNPVLEISTEGWTLGTYELEVVFNAPGMASHAKVIPYEYPPLPEWWNNRYGFDDMDLDVVPYPWTDMKVIGAEKTVISNQSSVISDKKSGGRDPQSAIRNPQSAIMHVWGREYRFGKGLFPEQVTTLGAPILRAPIRVLVETSDGEVLDTSALETQAAWTSAKRTRVEGFRSVEAGRLAVRNDIWAEYDGLLWNTLTLDPKSKTTIVSMRLEIPLTREFTDVVNNFDYHLRHTGKVKPEGQVAHLRHTWMGNGDGGIQWVACDCGEDGFRIRDKSTAVRVATAEEGATLVVTMLDIPTELTAPHTMQFGLIATPVRPKINRTPFSRERAPGAGHIGRGGPWYPRGGPFGDLAYMPAADPGYDYYGGGRKSGRHYLSPGMQNAGVDASGTADFEHYGDEWVKERFARPRALDEAAIVRVSIASKSYRDYYAWRHWRHRNVYGFKGLYYDGEAKPTLAARELFKRLYNITLANQHYAAREVDIGIHYSGMPNMAVFGFGTYFWDAENYNSKINATQPTYLGVTDPALYRAQHMGHNFGWPLFFLGQGRIGRKAVEANGGPEAVFDHITGLDLLHDGGGVCCVMPGGKDAVLREVSKRMSDAVSRHNLRHWIYQFMPYWRQDIVALPNENMHASWYIARPSVLTATKSNEWNNKRKVIENYFAIYKHLPPYIIAQFEDSFERERAYLETLEDKAVLILYNNTAWEGVMRLKPDWKKLGLGAPDTLTATNAVHSTGFRVEKTGEKDKDGKEVEKAVFFPRPEEYAKIEGEELVFPMTKWNYRMIVIEKR